MYVLNTKDFDESILQDMQGKKGISITTIQPYGKMEVEGIQIDVRSEGGYIEKNKMIEIILFIQMNIFKEASGM